MKSVENYYDSFDFGENKLEFKKVSQESILKTLKNLDINKASGIDNITGKFLRDGAKILALPISQICNLSITTSSFPDDCKMAKLKPLFKKGSKTDPKNFRPISLLPLISKVVERIIYDQTMDFLTENKVLYKFQSGFRKNHSTDFCLSYLTDKISSGFDEGLMTGMILIDLQKAFDTIDHEILIAKLPYIGFSDNSINWYKSYISNRKFKVNISDKFSSSADLTCGVPQGSILGPLLFLLYVNDMPQSVKCDLFLYADDSCLVYQAKELSKIESRLNEDFASICDWFVDNKLSIHFGEDKTKSILFATKNKSKNIGNLNISYKNINIKQYSSVTYLGCILDETLSGESMALYVLNKLNARLKFLYRKNEFLTPALRRLLCNALIQPHFDYACSAWYTSLNKKFRTKLQIMQNKCVRFCLQQGKRTHAGFIEFDKLNWLPVEKRFNQCLCVNTFKFYNDTCPLYLGDIFHPTEQNRINTRTSTLKLSQPLRKTNYGKNCISFMAPKTWNGLPSNIKTLENTNLFKHKVKDYYLQGLKDEYRDIYTY